MDQYPGAGPDESPDLVELLQADHARMADVLASADGSELVSGLSSHLVAESQLLYPVLRREVPDVDFAVDQLVETDHRLEELLADVDDDQGAAGIPAPIAALLSEHVRQQDALFAELRQRADPRELRRLGESLGPTIMEAPTHPHPHLPREGAFEVISDAVASSVDHIRDALKREREEP